MFVHNMFLLPLCTLAVTPPDSTPETSEPTHTVQMPSSPTIPWLVLVIKVRTLIARYLNVHRHLIQIVVVF